MLDLVPPIAGVDVHSVTVSKVSLDAVMPLRLQVDDSGVIIDAGRTFQKLLPDQQLLGELFTNFIRLSKPRHLAGYQHVSELVGQKLVFNAVAHSDFSLQAMVIELQEPTTWLFSFSLGSNLSSVIDTFGLHSKDFSLIDSSVDLMQVAAMQAELLSTSRDLTTRLEASRQEAERRALTDELTGLPNRRAFRQHLNELSTTASADEKTLNVLHIDLDNFKNINDRYGHAVGDGVLIKAAELILSTLRPNDFVARIGGDEFVIALFDDATIEDAHTIAQRIVTRLSEPFSIDGYTCQIGASVGLNACLVSDECDLEQIIIDADRALYEAKNAGRGQFRTFDHRMRSRYDEINALGKEMIDAIEADQFDAFFQPKVSLGSGEIWGVEALARWHHPKLGTLSAGHFLGAAEQNNLVSRLDEIVTRKALLALAGWDAKGLKIPHVSINITAARLGDPKFVEMLLATTAKASVLPSRVGLEVLETVLIEGTSEQLISTIERMSELGFTIELDDFGTGHASISNLRRIPVDVVKIDRTLVRDIDKDDELRRITGSVVDLINNLGIIPLAEGVETAEELTTLSDLNCAVVQGYYLAKPMSYSELLKWATSREVVRYHSRNCTDRAG